MTTKLVRDRTPHVVHPGRTEPPPPSALALVPRQNYADAIAAKLEEEVEGFSTAFAVCVDVDGYVKAGLRTRTDAGLRARAEFVTEAADVIEVVYAHARFLGLSREEVDRAVRERRDASGGFDAGVVLTDGEEP